MQQQPKQPRETGMPGCMIAFLVLACLAGLLLSRYEKALCDMIFAASRLLLGPLSLAGGRFAHAAEALAMLPEKYDTLSFAWQVYTSVSRWYAYALGIPCLLFLIFIGRKLSVTDVCRRTMTMRRLLQENMPFAPCIAPALNWPGGILKEPLDKGPWMAARQPVQLAAMHGLLLTPYNPPEVVPEGELLGDDHLPRCDSPWLGRYSKGLVLDREKTLALYASQIATPWRGYEALPPYLKKLAGAWALFAADEKDMAQRLLDEMSLSFRAPSPARKGGFGRKFPFFRPGTRGHGYCIDSHMDKETEKAVQKAFADKNISQAISRHGWWQDMALLALYEQARKRGILATAEFIWLKPVNRQLFYLCNNMGRRTAWPETAGAWAHYTAEKTLADLDPLADGIREPHVIEAVNALEMALYEDGWISPDKVSQEVKDQYSLLGQD